MSRIPMVVWALAFVAAPSLYGQTLDDIYAKESAINKYSNTIIHYEWVRDRHFGKDSAVNQAMVKILDDVAAWSQGYQSLAEIGPVGELSRIVTDVARGVRMQAAKSEDLLYRMDALRNQLDQAQKLLEDSHAIPDHPEFTKQKEEILNQREHLNNRINKLKNIIIDLRQTIIKVASGLGYDFFSAKLKAVIVAKGLGDSESLFAGYQDFIQAEVTAGPWFARLERESRRATRQMIALEAHSAKASLASLEASHLDVLNELEASPLHPVEAARIRAELENYVQEARARYQQTIEPYSAATLGQSMQRFKLRKFQKLCVDPQSPPSQRCDILTWLRKIDPTVVKTFDTEKIRDLETKWQVVEAHAGDLI